MKTVYDVLIRPIVTEATMTDIADKKYSFEVLPDASKPEIAAAVEKVFGVKVLKHTYWYEMTDEREEPLLPQTEEDITRAEWVEKKRLPEYLEGTYPSIVEVFVNAGLL